MILEKSRLAEERKRAEEALRQSEKLATMAQLLAGVAHELNNPLTVLIGYAGVLRSGTDGPSTKLRGRSVEYVAEQIETAAEQCSRIVGNFLALARKHPPERRRVALNRTISEAVELLAYPLKLDTVRVELDLAADLPDLWADQHQLQQVVVASTKRHSDTPRPRGRTDGLKGLGGLGVSPLVENELFEVGCDAMCVLS